MMTSPGQDSEMPLSALKTAAVPAQDAVSLTSHYPSDKEKDN
jgi:hypothetical protein